MPAECTPTPTDAALPRTEQNITDAIYDCLECIHDLFTEAGIKYSLFGGSLLGAVRSGGMIPWDDDGDIVIHSQDTGKVYDLRDRFFERGFEIRDFWHGMKIFRAGRPFLPDVDIFTVGDDYQYAQERTRLRWPGDPLPFGSLQRLHLVPFGHLMLSSVCDTDARQLLDDTYGEHWATTADKTHDHLYHQLYEHQGLVLLDIGCAYHSSHRRPARGTLRKDSKTRCLKIIDDDSSGLLDE